jgi:crotonobetainyl-CoA:carnitine CoA-transferase CaiB-like acyl-CoA transferase
MPVVPIADLLGAERAVSAAFVALRIRDHGDDATVRVVLDDAARAAAEPLAHGLTGPGAPLGGGLPTYAIYPSSDGFVAVAALEPHFQDRLIEHLGATDRELAAAFARHSGEYWAQVGADLDLPIVVVRQSGRAAAKEHR